MYLHIFHWKIKKWLGMHKCLQMLFREKDVR